MVNRLSFIPRQIKIAAIPFNTVITAVFVLVAGIVLALLPLKTAGIIVLGSSFFLLALHTPRLAVYLLIPAIPFSAMIKINAGGIAIGAMEGLLALALLAWLLKMIARQQIIIPHPPLMVPFFIFLGVTGLSWLTTFSLTASLVETLKWLEMLALYLFICANFTRDHLRPLIILLLLTGTVQGAIGVYQFVFKTGPEGFLLFAGRFLRAYGTFNQPNPYAGYLGLILPLAISLTLWSAEHLKQRSSLPTVIGLVLAGGSLTVMIAGLFASQSRGAWLGFAAAATLTILLKGGCRPAAGATVLMGAAILVSVGGLSLLPNTILQRFNDTLPYAGITDVSTIPVTDANFATIERLAHWQAAQAMWRDHLWLGVGFGNYQAIYPAYAVGRWQDALGHAHNYILNIGAETGLIGLLGYFIFWGWIIGFGIRAVKLAQPGSFQQAVAAGAVGIFAHLHIHNLFDNLYVQGMYLHVAIIFGLITLLEFNTEGLDECLY